MHSRYLANLLVLSDDDCYLHCHPTYVSPRTPGSDISFSSNIGVRLLDVYSVQGHSQDAGYNLLARIMKDCQIAY